MAIKFVWTNEKLILLVHSYLEEQKKRKKTCVVSHGLLRMCFQNFLWGQFVEQAVPLGNFMAVLYFVFHLNVMFKNLLRRYPCVNKISC